MNVNWTVFVEGLDDRAFLNSVLAYRKLDDIAIECIEGGVGKLRETESVVSVSNRVKRHRFVIPF